ncbi:serine/threonine-protein kinase [Tahibacter amnicola]|uniref:Serine/threonine protein kinase n=1 Tax=Tahibacter amnicola TaxID=2976241 RepID=A0ABY6BKN9_9GAMM|nr:serine/threonine-protein kinase [Tahibacter amnicola]UXI70186.1 serine/threonine protein kinase [Tahibacter amnicola]
MTAESATSGAGNGFPVIAGFTFTGLLGRGGMAAVYRARQDSLGRDVAIKVVEPDATDAARHLQRLEDEARGLAGLHHPSIVQLYDFGRTEHGAMYYVMPLLSGGDLLQWERPVAESRLVPLLERLLDALDHAHSSGIVHRDIKPENVLFDREGRPLLADFGAAQMPRPNRLTEDGTAIGSTGYMSPEQARGREVDARSDLYSLAVLAYEQLTGTLPFEGVDALSVALAQLEHPVPRLPRALRHWQAFFDRTLAVDPQKRYASAAQMREALPMPASSRPSWLSAVTTRLDKRWRLPAAVAAGLAIGALLFLVVGWLSGPRISAESIAALIQQGALTQPDEPNALDALRRAREAGMDADAVGALQSQLAGRLDENVRGALAADSLPALRVAWRRWQLAVDDFAFPQEGVVAERTDAVARRLSRDLDTALLRFDRTQASDALAVVDDWKSAPAALVSHAAKVRAIPEVGGHFADDNGPMLVLVRRPVDDESGLAVMSAPLQADLYDEFTRETRRAATSCEAAPGDYKGCIEHAVARQFAEWLSRRTGHSYRLPTLDELAQARPMLAAPPVVAWSNDCNAVTVARQQNAVRRTWGEVRSLFGRPAAPRTQTRCDGYQALPLAEADGQPRVLKSADASTGVILVREIKAAPASGS